MTAYDNQVFNSETNSPKTNLCVHHRSVTLHITHAEPESSMPGNSFEFGTFIRDSQVTRVMFAEMEMSAASSSGYDQHGIGSKHTRTIPLCPWERYITAFFLAWQAVLSFSYISTKLKKQNKKFQPDCNILASMEAGQDNWLPYIQRLRRFPASQEDKYRNKIKKKNNGRLNEKKPLYVLIK